MTPELLKQYLQVMRDAGVMSAQIKIDSADIAAVFGPDMQPSPLQVDAEGKPLENEPGAWKTWQSGPRGLDLPFVDEEKDA